MRESLLLAFSASHTSSRPSIHVRGSSTTDEGLPPSYNDATSGRGRQDYDRRDEEVSSSDVQELRRQSLAAMNAWRTKVLKRVGEALNIRAETILAEKARREALCGDESEQLSKHRFYASVPTSLVKLEREQKETLLSSLLLLLLSFESYSAYSRVLLSHICYSLDLPQTVLSSQESTTAKGLLTAAESMNADRETKAAANSNAAGRAWKVGLATVAGAALIGVTGGLAAPFLAAGVGGIFGAIGLGGTAAAGLLGGLAGNAVLIGGLFGTYGARMSGRMMDKYAAEISDFAFIPVSNPDESQSTDHHLRVGIVISGWLTSESEVCSPWKVLSPSAMETFALQWELSFLLELGTSLKAIATSYAWSYAQAEILKRTILSTLAAGLWPLGLVRVARVAENPFSIALVRADKAGELLADALINRAQGERPVNLIGYSLGARVIYSCLQSLARRRAFGLVENAVLIGAPCPSDAADWRFIRSVCVGRVANVYSTNDFILAFLYRSSRIQYGVAGVEAIEEVAGVESWDVSALISGHTRYRYLIGRVLKEIGLEGLDEDMIRKENEKLMEIDKQEAEAAKAPKKAPSRATKPKEENLIDFDDEKDILGNNAHELSDHDIEQRVQAMHITNHPATKHHPLDDGTVPPPPLPARTSTMEGRPRISNLSAKSSHTRQASEPLAELAPESVSISDDEDGHSTQGSRSAVPLSNRAEDTDHEDDPFARRGISMIDAEDEETAEREAERIERSVRKELASLRPEQSR